MCPATNSPVRDRPAKHKTMPSMVASICGCSMHRRAGHRGKPWRIGSHGIRYRVRTGGCMEHLFLSHQPQLGGHGHPIPHLLFPTSAMQPGKSYTLRCQEHPKQLPSQLPKMRHYSGFRRISTVSSGATPPAKRREEPLDMRPNHGLPGKWSIGDSNS